MPKYAVCSFFRLKELIKVNKEKAFSRCYCFFENAKNFGRSDNGKQRKKGMVLEVKTLTLLKMVRASFPVLLRF